MFYYLQRRFRAKNNLQFLIVAAVVFVVPSSFFTSSCSFDHSKASGELLNNTRTFFEAALLRDCQTISGLLSEKVHVVVPKYDEVLSRDEVVNRVCNYEYELTGIELDKTVAYVNGNVAEVQFEQMERIKDADERVIERKTHGKFYFVYEECGWKISSVVLIRTK